MGRLIHFLFFSLFMTPLLCATSAGAATMTEIAQPMQLPVRLMAKQWAGYLTSDRCHPGSTTFKVQMNSGESWAEIISSAVMMMNPDLSGVSVTALTDNAIAEDKTDELFKQMQISPNASFINRIFRFVRSPLAALVYSGDATGTGSKVRLGGKFLAIVDIEESELLILTYGEVFPPMACVP